MMKSDLPSSADISQREGSSDHSHSQHASNIPSEALFHSPPATTGLSLPAYFPRTLLQVQPAVPSLPPQQRGSQDPSVPTGFLRQPGSDDHSANHALVEDEGDSDEEDYSVDARHDIGLAMLQFESETLVIPSPQIYLPHGTSDDDLEFNPYDPVHMEKDYSRSPSPLVVLYARSDRSHDSYSSYAPSRAPSLALSHGSSSHESHRSQRHESMSVIPHLPQSAPPSQVAHMPSRPDLELLSQAPNPAPVRRLSDGHSVTQTQSLQPSKAMLVGRSPSQLRVRNPEAFSQDLPNVDVGYQKKALLFGGTTGGHHEDPPPYKAVAIAPTEQINELRSSSQQHHDDIRSTSDSININHSSNWHMKEIPPSDDSHESRRSSALNIAQSTDNIYIHSINRPGLPPPPAVPSESNLAGVTPGSKLKGPPPRDRSPPMLPARRSRERIQVPTPAVSALDMDQDRARVSAPIAPPTTSDRDVRSLYPSSVSITSSYLRNGPPPPHRRVPKHLVMPAPLNTNQNNLLERNNLQQQMSTPSSTGVQQLPRAHPTGFNPASSKPRYLPPSTVLANHQASLQSPPQHRVAKEYPIRVTAPPPLATTPVKTAVFVPIAPKAQDAAVPSSRKLKKRTSVLPPHAPSAATIVSTTVSFAPPVVGFPNLPEVEKNISRLKSEKVPKRVLSKKRTDI